MISLNPIARLANNALVNSRRVSLCRRAYSRARPRRDKRFWYVWEEKHIQAIISSAKMLERLLTLRNKVTVWDPSRLVEESKELVCTE